MSAIWGLDQRAERGNFTFSNMEPMQKLTAEVDATQLGYLFVLQTFIDYDTNILVIGRDRRPMTREDIQKALNVNRNTLGAFLSEMERYSVVMKDVDGRYIVNDTYIFRGRLGNGNPRVVKTYDMVARNLYEVTQSTRKVKQLGYLVKTLPYLHMYNNVICANPFEPDPELIQAFDKGQVAELFGVTEKSVYSLIRNMQFGDEVVFAEITRGQQHFYMVNPYICSRSDVGQGIKSLFKIARQPWYRKQAAKKAKESTKEIHSHSLCSSKGTH
ncbi:hypothetical protein SD70_31970 [Gordoniibacillus kamchatkensis]|uniref:Replication protein n=2 Tax=Gordoniibacillus kamchatkensis TaxID=1590651 RepID=A0ABR5A3X7_9BACL|nr:hypothetical protein SD70_31970 [Paenibacillus sp. VKM B-2647]